MTRLLAWVAFIAFCFSSVVPSSYAQVCTSPRIKRAKACGVVIDPYGMQVPNARITFGEPALGQETGTDRHGTFSSASEGDEVRMTVRAPGFQTIETRIGHLKAAEGSCKKPMFVMLTISEQGCSMISLRKSDLLLAKKE